MSFLFHLCLVFLEKCLLSCIFSSAHNMSFFRCHSSVYFFLLIYFSLIIVNFLLLGQRNFYLIQDILYFYIALLSVWFWLYFLISIEFYSARQWSYLWLGLILLRLVFESLDCPFFLEFSLLLRYILFEFSEWSAKVLYWVLWMISKDSTVASWSSTVFLPFLSSETVQVTIFWSPFVCLCAF